VRPIEIGGPLARFMLWAGVGAVAYLQLQIRPWRARYGLTVWRSTGE
jgi:hypothetical protein